MFYKKTKRGEQVSPVNTCGLTWPQRFALMLINGQRSDAELRSTINSRVDEIMLALAEQGFIERVSEQTPVDAPMDAPEPTRAPYKMRELKRAAVRWLTDQLGPHADPINLKIERAATQDELNDALKLGHLFAVQQLGAAKAKGFDKFAASRAVP